jgi:eukaryotic-like serine/threonine-protein kinase
MPHKKAPNRTPADAGTSLTRLGKYSIERQLGVGGMGTVYLAVDTDLKRTVALKVLPRDRAENPILVRRFKSEGQAAALLDHDNIVSVYEAGQADGYLFLALEYVDGIDILEWIRKRGPLPVKRSIEIIKQTAEALQHAYERNIVHRDIKPSNLMITREGKVKLTDMGLARSIDDTLETNITRDGTTVGTVDYMAPEQGADSKAADVRSDIYSLGCTWYHMLTASAPYPEGSVTNKLTAHATAPLPDPREKNPRVPEAIVAVLHRMMAKRKENRYATPAELIEDLDSEAIRRGDDPVNLLEVFAEEDWEDSGSIEVQSEDLVPSSPPGSTQSAPARSDSPPAESDRFESTRPPASRQSGRSKSGRRELPARVGPTGSEPHPPSGSKRKPPKPPPPRLTRIRPSDSSPPESEPDGSTGKRSAPDPDSPTRELATNERAQQPAGADGKQSPTEPSGTKPSDRESRSGSRGKPTPQLLKRRRYGESEESSEPSEQTPQTSRIPRDEVPADSGRQTSPDRPAINIDSRRLLMAALIVALIAGMVWWAGSYLGGRAAAPENVPDVAAVPGDEAPPPDDEETDAPDEEPVAMSPDEEPAPDETDPASPSRDLADVLPDWLRPGWKRPPSEGMRTLQVQRGTRDGRDSFHTLDAALSAAEEAGGRVEIRGTGPWTASPMRFENRERLVITGREGVQPVISLDAGRMLESLEASDADDPPLGWLSVSRGRLELEGLHLVVTHRGDPDAVLSLLSVTEGEVILRNCTVTLLGPGPVEILMLHGQKADANRILVENCLLRGETMTAVRGLRSACDLVFDNCLLASGTAEVIRLDAAAGETPQTLRFLKSTIFTGTTAFRFRHEESAAPGPVRLEFQRSLLLAQAAGESPLFDFVNWPRSEASRLDSPRPANVALNTQHLRVIGAQTLAGHTPPEGDPFIARNATEWRQFWKRSLPSDDLLPESPLSDENLPALQQVTARKLDELYGEMARPGVGTRALLGCEAASVAVPPAPFIRRIEIVSARPSFPDGFGSQWKPQRTVRFDLVRRADKLAEFLNSPDCPDGTHVICHGTGLRTLPSVVLKDRRLRIEFEQSEGTPLTLQPAPDDDADAWLTIDGGRVDLVNGNFVIPDSGRRRYPPALLATTGAGEFALRGWSVRGSSETSHPLIDLPEHTEETGIPFTLISDSFLVSAGPVLRAPLAGRSVEIDNSVLASRSAALMLSGGERPGGLLAHHCTLMADESLVTFSTSDGAAPVDLLFRNVVYAPPVSRTSVSTLLLVDDPETIGTGLRWWESGCGYAPQWPGLLRSGDAILARGVDSGWADRWGPGHLVDPVQGARGVLFKQTLPGWADLAAEHFELDPTCQAARWSESGGPIGAFVDQVGPRLKPPEKSDEKPSPPRRPTGRPQPDF